MTFWYPKSVRHIKFPLRIVIYPCCARKFPDIRNFLKHWTVRPRTFSVVWDKNFNGKLCYTSLVHKNCRNPESMNLTKVPLQFFLVLWHHQISERKSWMPHLLRKNFWCPKLFETLKGSPTYFFPTVRNKISTKNLDTPLLFIKFVDAQNFLKYSKVGLRNFSLLWNKNCSTENRFITNLMHKNFLMSKTFWNTNGFAWYLFRYCETKNFRQKLVL